MKIQGSMLVGIFVLSAAALTGCGAPAPQQEEGAIAATAEEGLSAASVKKAIENSVQPLWIEPCGSNRALTTRQIPRALRATLRAEKARLKALALEEFEANDIEDSTVYAVYGRRRAIVGYAVRIGIANGSGFAGWVTGYDTKGKKVSEQTDIAQDDQDAEEEVVCN